jgi:hypothetical protein
MIPDNSRKKMEQLRQEMAFRAQLQQQYDKEMSKVPMAQMIPFSQWMDQRPKPMKKGGGVDALMEELRKSIGNEPFDPIGTAKRNIQGAVDIAKQVPSNLKRLATDPVAYAKSLPEPSGEQIMNMLQPSTIGAMAGVIKPVGGNWLRGSVEDSLRPLRRNTAGGNDVSDVLRQMKEKYTPEEIDKLQEGSKRHVTEQIDTLEKMDALNKWVNSNLTGYIKKQMGTAEDPVRKLAEQGIVHIPENQVGINRYKAPAHREKNRTQQLGQSENAKAWEDASDVAINPMQLKDVPGSYREFWMENAPQDTAISHLSGVFDTQALGFDHIMDTLRQDVAAGRIRPEQLNKVSMEQAVRRTHELDQEMARRMRESALKQTEGFPVHKDYADKGYKWLELTNPKTVPKDYVLPEGMKLDTIDHPRYGLLHTVSDPKGITQIEATNSPQDALLRYYNRRGGEGYKALEDALQYEGNTMGHCVGGYCPDVSAGRSRIFSLRDTKGEPHVTVEVNPVDKHPIGYGMSGGKSFPDDFRYESGSISPEQHQQIYQRAKQLFNPDLANDLSSHRMDVFQQAANEIIGKPADRIVQIKGKQNAKPKEDYLPYVQDFIRGSDWTDVGDLHNANMVNSNNIRKAGWDVPEGTPKYITNAEYEKIKADTDANTAGTGMKRGGKVRIAKFGDITSQDEMRLALTKRRGTTKS